MASSCILQSQNDTTRTELQYLQQRVAKSGHNVKKKWRVFLQCTKEPFVVKTDYKNFINFLTIKELNKRQVRWTKMFMKYHFEIKHVKGLDNTKADAFSKKNKL